MATAAAEAEVVVEVEVDSTTKDPIHQLQRASRHCSCKNAAEGLACFFDGESVVEVGKEKRERERETKR